jgi:hypothetical protein
MRMTASTNVIVFAQVAKSAIRCPMREATNEGLITTRPAGI